MKVICSWRCDTLKFLEFVCKQIKVCTLPLVNYSTTLGLLVLPCFPMKSESENALFVFSIALPRYLCVAEAVAQWPKCTET